MADQTDFMVAINQIASERNIEIEDILESIEQAIKTGFKRNMSEEEGALLNVEVDRETGEVTVYMDKKVVKKVTSEATQIGLKEAKALEPKLKEGDHVEIDITPSGDFGRVAAQAAKQVILQKLREVEKDSQVKRLKDRIGDIETGIVQRMEGDSVIWEVSKAIAVMPQNERIPNEFYRSGSKHRIFLKEIKETPRGKMVIVSRADAKFLEALFKLEIPEITSETIEIKGIAREVGQRSKVAVHSNVDGIDPIGSCVGQKGMRINSIMNELKVGNIEEKIDIILWDADESQFVINSLSPAQVIKTQIISKPNKIIRVIVPDEQLSLAIGRDGQNVRLAAKLTGWNIDIQGETVKVESETAKLNDIAVIEEKEKPKKKVAKKTTKKTEKPEVVKEPKVVKKATKKAVKKEAVFKKETSKVKVVKKPVKKEVKKVAKKVEKKETKKVVVKEVKKVVKKPAKKVVKK